MQNNAISFPYPVLGNADDVTGEFTYTNFKYNLQMDRLAVTFEWILNQPDIQKMIDHGNAAFRTEIICAATNYRRSFVSKDRRFEQLFSMQDIRGRVDVTFCIISLQSQTDYLPVGTDTLFGGQGFTIEYGDKIAIHAPGWFIPNQGFDLNDAANSTFVKVQEGGELIGPVEVNWSSQPDNYLIIQLPKEDYKAYLVAQQDSVAKKTLHASLVLPVLVQAVHAIAEGDEDYYNPRLAAVLREKGVDLEDITNPLEAAQKLLDSPIGRHLQAIQELTLKEGVDDESEEN